MKYDVQLAVEILQRTPQVLRTMLSGLSEVWTHTNYGQDTFSPFDVVGHLIHGEKADWQARIRIILEHGPDRPFDPYDRYAQFEDNRGKTLDELLDQFATLRAKNIVFLQGLHLSPAQLARRGTHPKLGEISLENLLATWVAHDLNHIAQIAKCMATQYDEAVGPWKAYLSILKTPVTQMDKEGAERRRAVLA